MKGKGQTYKEGDKMKRMVMAVLIVMVLVSASNAFAYWKSPIPAEVNKPMACPFNNNAF